MSSMISICGNAAAMRSIDGISLGTVAGTPCSVAVAAPSRTHLRHSPYGASAGAGVLHLGWVRTLALLLLTRGSGGVLEARL
jgi:hypothetical protein